MLFPNKKLFYKDKNHKKVLKIFKNQYKIYN